MAHELVCLAPRGNLSDNNFVSMECFSEQQLENAINYSLKVTALLQQDAVVTPFSECCTVHPQMKLDWFCRQCRVDLCRECIISKHRGHECTASSDKIHEETQRMGEATNGIVELLKDTEQAILRPKEMKQTVRNRKDRQ